MRRSTLAASVVRRERLLVVEAPALSLLAGVLQHAGDPGAIAVAQRSVDLWREMGEPDLLGMVDALCVLATKPWATATSSGQSCAPRGRSTRRRTRHRISCRSVPPSPWPTSTVPPADTADATSRLSNVYHQARFAGVRPLVLDLIDTDRVPPTSPRRSPRSRTHRSRARRPPTAGQPPHLPRDGPRVATSRATPSRPTYTGIYRKLGVSSRSAAIEEARRRGFLVGAASPANSYQ